MDKSIIINKLIEKKIIESESDLDKDLEYYVSLLENDYPQKDTAKQILESDLLEKYGPKILNECIRLEPSAKLSNTRFKDGMTIEDMEVYCKIKQGNPELDIIKKDKFLHSIKKEYIEKYNIKDLGFIIGNLEISSNTISGRLQRN